jgi:uncharacterized protein
MNCPHDSTQMEKRKYENIFEIDYCPKCKGMWLDTEKLEAIQEIKVNDYKDELEKIPDYVGNSFLMAKTKDYGQIVCPVCSSVLERKEYGYCSQIFIDYCVNGHGLWLDENELKDLEIFYERSRKETDNGRKGFFKGLLDLFK